MCHFSQARGSKCFSCNTIENKEMHAHWMGSMGMRTCPNEDIRESTTHKPSTKREVRHLRSLSTEFRWECLSWCVANCEVSTHFEMRRNQRKKTRWTPPVTGTAEVAEPRLGWTYRGLWDSRRCLALYVCFYNYVIYTLLLMFSSGRLSCHH